MEFQNNLPICTFCDFLDSKQGYITSEFLEAYPKLEKTGQVIEVSDNLFLTPDIAPLTTDHLLLVTKSHFRSFADTPDALQEELNLFASNIIKKMKDLHPTSEIVAFEHGVGTINGKMVRCGSCGRTDHAHLHILPIPQQEHIISTELAKAIRQKYHLRLQEVIPLPKFDIKMFAKDFPYLYLWSDNNSCAYILIQDSPLVDIPSQLIRKLLAIQYLGVEDKIRWDWRDFIVFHPHDGEQMVEYTLSRW